MSMSKTIKQYVVDAFTDKVFHGNPAAICIKLPYCTVSIELSGILLVLEYKSRYLKVIGLKNAIDNSFSTFSSGCSGGLYEKLNRFK